MFYFIHIGLKMLRKFQTKEKETNVDGNNETNGTNVVENIIITYPSIVHHEVLVQPRKKDHDNTIEVENHSYRVCNSS